MQGKVCAGHRACFLPPLHTQTSRAFSFQQHRRQQQQWQLQRHRCDRNRQRSTVHAESAERLKPAYNKYRSRNDIQQSYIREWQKTTARDGMIEPQTILSTLWYVPTWLKYHAVPYILRYAWYIVWLQIVAVYQKYHTWAVLQGAKLDMYLAKKGNTPMQTFSRSLVMRRYHHNVSMRENLSYRWRLYKGKSHEGAFLQNEMVRA